MTEDMEKELKNKHERALIFEMIDASCELAAIKGFHDLDAGCFCMACVTRRKKMLYPPIREWKFHL
ncbi:MAG: hypothetical protein WC799_03935 [Desulfobacteraceae bacterium]|jgi:hypothetical protein